MDVRWITAFLDTPASSIVAATAFWAAVTESELSPRRGEFDEFVTFLPSTGHPYFRAQVAGEGPARVHLDFHVDDTGAAVAGAERLGASTAPATS